MWTAAALLGLLALGDVASAALDGKGRVLRKRTTKTVELYAYGTNISGLAVYAGSDNLAYIVSDEAAADYASLIWTIDTTGADAWTVAANSTATATNTTNTNTTSTLASGSTFYVVADTDAGDSFAQAGFVASTDTVPSNATTTGFVTYGPYVMLLLEDSTTGDETYISEFWAQTTGIDGVWQLMWNEAGTAQTDSTPVSIKTTAPITS